MLCFTILELRKCLHRNNVYIRHLHTIMILHDQEMLLLMVSFKLPAAKSGGSYLRMRMDGNAQ